MNLLGKIDLKDPVKRDGLLILMITILGAALFFHQVIMPQQQEYASLEKVYKKKSAELNAIRNMKTQRDRLTEENARRKAQLDSLREMFPDQKEIAKLISDIHDIAQASGIYTQRFNPLPDIVRQHHVENRYQLTVMGGYHQMGNFFAYLANLPLIVNLSNVRINTSPNIEASIAEFEEHGRVVRSTVASFEMTTFSSKK
ncbi:MAG: type 4a pilus biogenesis protein PilO [Fibrobacterota bacterium]